MKSAACVTIIDHNIAFRIAIPDSYSTEEESSRSEKGNSLLDK